MFDQISEDVLKSVTAKIDRRVAQKVKKLEEAVNQSRPIHIVYDDFVSPTLDGIQHKNFEHLIRVVHANTPVMLVGPAGTGKSHAAEQVANAMGLDFYAMSVGAQTSKSDIIGYMDAMQNYVRTVFRNAYEHGGLFLLDEIDAGNSNVLIQLNAALANNYMSFPDGMIRRHDKFRMVASANTFGLGASRQYVGRNQLDAATLDRFVVLSWDIDENLEQNLAVGKYGAAWLDIVRYVRSFVNDQELRVVVSPRATQRGSLLLSHGMDFNDVLHMALLHQFGAEHKRDLHVECHTRWRNNLDIIDKLLTDDSNAGNWNKLAEQYNACEDVRNAYNLLLTLHQRAALHLQYDRLDDSIKTSVEQLLNHTDDGTKLKSLVLYMVNNNDADADAYQVRNGLVYQLYINEWDFRPSMTKYLQDNQNNLPEVPFLIE
jgi:SpoVK/Ycf46/Vps4 family AAA+-type ATPase